MSQSLPRPTTNGIPSPLAETPYRGQRDKGCKDNKTPFPFGKHPPEKRGGANQRRNASVKCLQKANGRGNTSGKRRENKQASPSRRGLYAKVPSSPPGRGGRDKRQSVPSTCETSFSTETLTDGKACKRPPLAEAPARPKKGGGKTPHSIAHPFPFAVRRLAAAPSGTSSRNGRWSGEGRGHHSSGGVCNPQCSHRH